MRLGASASRLGARRGAGMSISRGRPPSRGCSAGCCRTCADVRRRRCGRASRGARRAAARRSGAVEGARASVRGRQQGQPLRRRQAPRRRAPAAAQQRQLRLHARRGRAPRCAPRRCACARRPARVRARRVPRWRDRGRPDRHLSTAGGVGAGGCAGLRATGGLDHRRGASRPPASAPPGPPSLRVLRFSTTTDLERPWLKFCRTWPLSTVRCSDSGLRAPPRRVLSVVSLVSVMRFRSNLRNSTCFLASGCTQARPIAPQALGLA